MSLLCACVCVCLPARARAPLSMFSARCAAGKGSGVKKLWPASLLALSIVVVVALCNTCPSCNSDAVWLSLHPSSSASLIAPEFSHIPKPTSFPELSELDKAVYRVREPHLPSREPHENSSDYELGSDEADSSLNASDENSTHINASDESSTHIVEVVDSEKTDSEVQADKAGNTSHHEEFLAPLDRYAGISEGHESPEALRMDHDLVAAKRAIASAVAKADTHLHAPLYHNVTMFIKSYELMEQIFKIYVYKEGALPLVHTGPTVGIYASEGRFIHQLQSSKRFVTHDPNKAHLFFMSYSVTNMVRKIYVPDSHSMQPLIHFITSYVELIASKYPYWNRSHGADHFFVSCHDWGPATARHNEELRRNGIKVVCNADETEEFVVGKDVSLPETYLHAAKPPSKLGGPPPRKRPYLAFFAGQMHGRVRPILLQHWKDKDKDMKIYEKIPAGIAKKTSYIRHMRMSKFCICPMGFEVNSPRIVEAIYYDCVPVIIADNFVLPFSEVLNWQAFSVSVPERDVPRLKQILLSIPSNKYNTMQANLKHVRQHFLWHFRIPAKYDVFHMILHSLWIRRLASVSVNLS